MKDIQQFVEIHRRIQGTPPEMPSPLQDVWKKLQQFAAENPLAFYELTVCFTFPKGFAPQNPWRTKIVEAGFASISKAGAKLEVTIHDLVDIIFKEYLLERRETKSLPPPPAPPAVDPGPPAPTPIRARKKKNATKP